LAVEKAHAERKKLHIPVRQPLNLATISGIKQMDKWLEDLLKDEVNVKNVKVVGGDVVSVELETTITPELKVEGEAREIIRQIQDERKKLGTKLDQRVDVSLPSWPKEHEEEIVKKALIDELSRGEFRVTPK
jgi:isoleucyl-tRNA synthetase